MFTEGYSQLTWNWTSNPVWGAGDSSVYVDLLGQIVAGNRIYQKRYYLSSCLIVHNRDGNAMQLILEYAATTVQKPA